MFKGSVNAAIKQSLMARPVISLLTLGAQFICMPGTGRVVMYMVTQRYKYKVPMRKKNRLITIDLQIENTDTNTSEIHTKRNAYSTLFAGNSYLYLKKNNWMSQMTSSTMPLTSVTVNAHFTLSM